MSASIAIAASASASAAAANARARKAECVSLMKGYEDTKATVGDRRDYASCVYTIHGDGVPMTGAELIILKIIIFIALASIPVGVWWGYKEDGVGFAILTGIVLPVALGAGALVLGVILYGFYFLFT